MLRPIRLRAGIALLLVGWLPGCHSAATPAGPAPRAAAACVIADDAPRPNLRLALSAAIDGSRAPAPHNADERLIYRQLYETLVTVDCEGRVLPGLAESWSASEQGRVWQFRLRNAARFWDGSPVTARDIIEGWANNTTAPSTSAVFARMTAAGERELLVELHSAAAQPHLFARADLAVARRTTASAWPIGSGPFRNDTTVNAPAIRFVATNASADRLQFIDVRRVDSADPRRALDADADAVVSADAAALDYARALADYNVTPLRWNRTYALATRAVPGAADSVDMTPTEARFALARDAVRADTRAAEPPFWWLAAACPRAPAVPPRPLDRSTGTNTIVHARGDAIARAIAERLVALAWPASNAPAWLRALLPADYARGGAPKAQPLDEPAMLEVLRDYRALAFVAPLPRVDGNACAAPALSADAFALTLAAAPEWRITPLVDVRDYLIHRPGLGRITIDGDGTIRFSGNER